MKELEHLRTRTSKTFLVADRGDAIDIEIRARTRPIHVNKGAGWQDVDCTLDAQGRVKAAHYDIELLKDGIGYVGTDPDKREVELRLDGFGYREPEINGNVVLYRDIRPDTDYKLVFLPSSVRSLWVVKSATAVRTLTYLHRRDPAAKGKLINYGEDSKRRRAQLTVATQLTAPDAKRITQTWTGKVIKRGPKREPLLVDPTYPVEIDPTSTFTITANANDGFGRKSTGTLNSLSAASTHPSLKMVANARTSQWFRFPGITIPQFSTINSATFKFYGMAFGSLTFSGQVQVDNRATPGNPTTAGQVCYPTSVVSGVIGFPISPGTSVGNKASYSLFSPDVTSPVQSLVNQRDYSSGEMVLYLSHGIGSSTASTAFVYHRDWGTTKDAELVINFTSETYRRRIIVG